MMILLLLKIFFFKNPIIFKINDIMNKYYKIFVNEVYKNKEI